MTDRQIPGDPMERTLLHRALLLSNALQELPAILVALVIAFDGVLVAVSWQRQGRVDEVLPVTLGYLIASAVNWVMLWALPRAGRSFGPDRPAALALASLLGLIASTMAVLPLPWWSALLVVALISLAAFYATWIEPFLLGVTRQRLIWPEWKADAPLRLLHVGDLHVERVTPRERELNRLIAELEPDVIVFSGDFVNLSYTHDPEAEAAIRSIVGEWHAPLGVYCVPGTPIVEPMERVQAFVRGFDQIKLLANSWMTVETPGGALHILGLVTTHQLDVDRTALKRMMLVAPKSGLRLLLTHSPDLAPEAAAAGIDLYLCGHTHGGQIRLPLLGALISSSQLGKRFVMGRHQVGQMTLYTTRGVGMEGLGAPRARFLCPPEIVLWEIGGSERQ